MLTDGPVPLPPQGYPAPVVEPEPDPEPEPVALEQPAEIAMLAKGDRP